ncbi:MAG: tetratricopeptide repeat protein [candidate division Zixibacteria bacterium]|nr:tetratricopeptide repeat protein [candidate division Zixibacteria bacterium]
MEDGALQHFRDGVIYFNEGLVKAAESEFLSAIKLNPGMAAAYHNLGVISYLNREFESALNSFKKAVQLNEDDAEFQYNLGLTCYQLSLYKKAISRFEFATLLNPSYAEAFYGLALAYKKSGESDKADRAYAESIKLKPDIEKLGFQFHAVEAEMEVAEKPGIQTEISTLNSGYSDINIANITKIRNIDLRDTRTDLYFSKNLQIGFSVGPSFPENYYYKLVSGSPDRLSIASHIGVAFPRRSNFLGDFGGDGYGIALKGRYVYKKTNDDEWFEYSLALNIRVFEDLDDEGRGKFFIAFGPGIYVVDTKYTDGNGDSSQYGLEGGAGFDYLLIPAISICAEASYAFTYHGKHFFTNSLGNIQFGFNIHF